MRRLVSLAVLLACLAAGHQARLGAFGTLGGAVWVAAIFIGLAAAVMAVLDLPLGRGLDSPNSGFDHEGQLKPGAAVVGALGIGLFAAGFGWIAVRGMVRGAIPTFGRGPDATLAAEPVAFVLWCLVWVALAAGTAWLGWQALRSARRGRAKGTAHPRA